MVPGKHFTLERAYPDEGHRLTIGDRTPSPDVRRVVPGRSAAGHGWLGLRRNGDYVVTGFGEVPLLPAVAALLLAIGLLIAAWRREGR